MGGETCAGGGGARPGGWSRTQRTDPAPGKPTFHQLVDKRAQVVGLLLLPFTHLDDVSKILADVLQQLRAHLHFSLKEPEQRVLRSFEQRPE